MAIENENNIGSLNMRIVCGAQSICIYIEVKKVKSDNFTRSNREKSNIVIDKY